MLKHRLISFPLLIALGALIFCWKAGGFYLYTIVAPLALGLAVYEAAAMLQKTGVASYPKLTGLAAALLALGGLNLQWVLEKFPLSTRIDLMVSGAAGLLLLPALVLIFRKEGILEKIIGSAGVLLTLGLPLLATVCCWNLRIPAFNFNPFASEGVSAMLFLIAVSKSMDTGGYIFGMLSARLLPGGNHKIAPSISPKKSWEGFFGGLVLTVLAACCFHWWGGLKIWWCVATGVVLAVGSFFGDLTESAIKRRCDIKDSGSYIPGMGGALDILDSFIFNGILLIIMVVVFYGKF
jgi:phosphatidate cytidylyltransferase